MGTLCLDFVNAQESLRSYADLLRWAEQAAVLDAATAGRQRRAASRQPRRARAVLASALRLREALYRIFAARTQAKAPGPRDLEVLNEWLGQALSRQRLAAHGSRCRWEWDLAGPGAFGGVLWPVARSAADLLLSNDTDTVRECASQTCNWLFLDRSPARRRRWCDMKTCGNRSKARRFYARSRARARARGPAPATPPRRRP